MLKKQTTIIWDWNGTLIDDLHICLESINAMLKRRHLPLLSSSVYRQIFDFPVINYYLKLGFDLEKESFDHVSVEFHDEYLKRLNIGELHKHALYILNYFQTKGIPQNILSALRHDLLIDSVQALNVTSYFKNIAGNKNLKGHSKTEFGLNLLKKLIYNPEHTYLIGDTTHDAEVAHAMGIKCILVADGHQSKERLLATKMPVVNNLKELPALF